MNFEKHIVRKKRIIIAYQLDFLVQDNMTNFFLDNTNTFQQYCVYNVITNNQTYFIHNKFR